MRGDLAKRLLDNLLLFTILKLGWNATSTILLGKSLDILV
jgi:hypothetical protein